MEFLNDQKFKIKNNLDFKKNKAAHAVISFIENIEKVTYDLLFAESLVTKTI